MAITALHSAASGLSALSTQLDVISNNLANANNNGFKASRVDFEDLLYQAKQQPGVENANNDISPTGIAVGLGTRVAGTSVDFTQGSLITTNQQYDVAIQGDGFFRVKTLASQGDGLAYTRTGHFFKNTNGDLVLNSADGYKLDPGVNVPANTTGITISSDGRVFATVAGSTTPTALSPIQLVRFPNEQGLSQIGGNLFQQTSASGNPTIGTPGTDGLGTLQQGTLEASNVDPVTELVNLIKTQRTFEMNSQSIQAADQMLQTVGNLRH